MKKRSKKLVLSKETVRGLSDLEWGDVVGGGYTDAAGTLNTLTCPFTCQCERYKPPTA